MTLTLDVELPGDLDRFHCRKPSMLGCSLC